MQSGHKTIKISVDFSKCFAHLFKITMILDCAKPKQQMSLPVWTPGSYMVREFSQHIVSVSGNENGGSINVRKLNKNTFEFNNDGAFLSVTYEVYGFDSSIRAAFIDGTQAFFNGTALFLRPHQLDDARFVVSLHPPTGEHFKDWEVAIAMPPVDIDARGFGDYQAQSYQELIDYPCQISVMRRLSYSVDRIPHEIVLVGDVRPCDENRLLKDLKELCTTQIALFGNGAPFDRYLFIARFEEGGHGGLEHRNSSMLLSSPYGLPKKGQQEPCPHYRNFLSLCSHEYFHAWNVKRLKPPNFVNYDLDNECYTTMLWLFEGFTSYYDDLLVKRAGLISLSSYLDLMGKNYSKLLRNKGRHVQSVAESSFDAWIKFYRPNENSMNASVSYYLKGSFIALYLDLLIRQQTNQGSCLDDVMRAAYRQYGNEQGMVEEQFYTLLSEIGKIDVISFKEKYINGKDELPLASMLNEVGIDISITGDELFLDDKTKMSAFLGFKIRFDENDRALITFVEEDGPGMLAMLSPGDEIIAINNTRIDPSNAHDIFGGMKADQSVHLLYSRKKIIRQAVMIPTTLPLQTCKLAVKAKLDSSTQKRLETWLGTLGSQ